MIGFWIFMLIMVMLVPGVMILFGTRFRKASPKNINYLFGYRTARSMKNRDTWEFAHQIFGKLWVRFGIPTLILSVVGMIFLFGKRVDIVGYAGMILVFSQCVVMVVPLFLTEHELKRNFDQFGRRK